MPAHSATGALAPSTSPNTSVPETLESLATKEIPESNQPAPVDHVVTDDAANTEPSAPTTDAAPIPDEAPVGRRFTLPNSLNALAHKHFRVYVLSLFVGSMGVWIQRIAQDWLILQLTGSVSAVGVAVALQFAPVLLFGLYGGILTDRYDPRRLLAISQGTSAALALVLGIAVLTGHATPLACYGLALGLGLVSVIDQPARLALISQLVGVGGVRSALGLNTTAFQSAGLLSPLASGVLIGSVGIGWCFLINAVTCTSVALATTLMGRRTLTPRVEGVAKKGPIAELREGLTVIARTSEVAWAIGLVAILGVFGMNMPVLLSAFSSKEFTAGVSGYSTFQAVVAVGSVVGATVASRRVGTIRLRNITPTLTGLGVLLVLTSRAPSYLMFLAVLALVGVVSIVFSQSANALVQTTVPDHLRGRVMSVYVLVLLGGQAIGGVTIGAVIDHFGPRTGMLLNGAVIILLTSVCAAVMAHRSALRLRVTRGKHVPHLQIVHR